VPVPLSTNESKRRHGASSTQTRKRSCCRAGCRCAALRLRGGAPLVLLAVDSPLGSQVPLVRSSPLPARGPPCRLRGPSHGPTQLATSPSRPRQGQALSSLHASATPLILSSLSSTQDTSLARAAGPLCNRLWSMLRPISPCDARRPCAARRPSRAVARRTTVDSTDIGGEADTRSTAGAGRRLEMGAIRRNQAQSAAHTDPTPAAAAARRLRRRASQDGTLGASLFFGARRGGLGRRRHLADLADELVEAILATDTSFG